MQDQTHTTTVTLILIFRQKLKNSKFSEKKMPLEETIYTTSQISIPAELPDLLKQYTKAAIRTQPPDILQW